MFCHLPAELSRDHHRDRRRPPRHAPGQVRKIPSFFSPILKAHLGPALAPVSTPSSIPPGSTAENCPRHGCPRQVSQLTLHIIANSQMTTLSPARVSDPNQFGL